jgi:PAS domain S-box-containing protein
MSLHQALRKTESVDTIPPAITRNIFESLPVGLMVISPQGDIVFSNPAAHHLLGHPQGTFAGGGWGELFFDMEKNIDFNQVIIDVIRGREMQFNRNVPYHTPAGEVRHLSLTSSLLQEQGETVGLVVLIHDMTEIHRMREREKEILEEQHQLQSQRAESLRHLALAVAHQIRNPLVSIGGFAMRMLRKANGRSPDSAYLQSILKGTDRLEDLVRAVREYAELSPAGFRKTSLNQILERARSRMDKTASALSRKVTWKALLPPVEILADPELLQQAMEEILRNAVESFRGDEGEVRIELSRQGDWIRIRVSDNGRGISMQDQPYIFDPFFSSKASGIGIGLSKAQRIVKEHRGEVFVHSGIGKGTTVDIRLPVQ